MNWFTSFKKSKALAFVAGLALAAAAGAAAAFLIYSGLSGGSSGNFSSNASTQSALIVSSDGSVGALDAGGTVIMPIRVTNADGNDQHILSANATPSFTATPSVCASHLSVGAYTDPVSGNPSQAFAAGTSYGPGQARQVQVAIVADASTPGVCANGSYTVSWTATTS